MNASLEIQICVLVHDKTRSLLFKLMGKRCVLQTLFISHTDEMSRGNDKSRQKLWDVGIDLAGKLVPKKSKQTFLQHKPVDD